MKRALWLPNWIGDAVMATPAIRHLRIHFPDDQMVGIYRPPNKELFAGSDLLDGLILDQSGSKHSWKQKLEFIRQLKREQFDEIILLTNSLRTAAVARISGIPRRVGFARDGRSWLLTDRLQPKSKKTPNPVLDEYLRLAQHVTQADSALKEMELATTAQDEQHWKLFAQKNALSSGGYICFNSGGAFGAAKVWPLEHYVALAKRIIDEYNKPVVMLCGPAEQELARNFVKQVGSSKVFSLAEEVISVGLSKAVVKHSSLMLTTDSGPRHFAAAFDVPVITLFGPTHIPWSETFYAKSLHLQLPVDCGPCQKRICPLKHHRCMNELTSDYVFEQMSRFGSIEKDTSHDAA